MQWFPELNFPAKVRLNESLCLYQYPSLVHVCQFTQHQYTSITTGLFLHLQAPGLQQKGDSNFIMHTPGVYEWSCFIPVWFFIWSSGGHKDGTRSIIKSDILFRFA